MKVLAIVLALLTISCVDYQQSPEEIAQQNYYTYTSVQNISFVQHKETGLCFAVLYFSEPDGLSGKSLATVPCDAVRSQLRKSK
jgi:hypothetical protein